MAEPNVASTLATLGESIRTEFAHARRVMSFVEYLAIAAEAPRQQLRTSAQYLRDAMDHFGTVDVAYPWGTVRRFRIFDTPWTEREASLFGQEPAQEHLYRQLQSFIQDGTPNRVLLLHGPNGSAKTTFLRCLGRGLERYSADDAGALYRFAWIFPSQKSTRGSIGFGGDGRGEFDAVATFAHLPDDLVDARITDELRDHPLLLIPPAERERLMDGWLLSSRPAHGDTFVVGDYLRHGTMSPKNRIIYDALLASYQGDYLKVLRHVQVQRFDVAQRYRTGWVTVEPQLSVDATERQLTADRSLAALPPSLQAVALFDYGGEVVGANRGFIEFDDLLKRPLEHYKYLLTTVERAALSMHSATLPLDLCFLGSCNDVHLSAFRELPDFPSFRGRLELIRLPYILDVRQEESLYAERLREAAGKRHVAPHTAFVAALWGVLTRLRRPEPARYPNLAEVIAALTPMDKAKLYSTGSPPSELTSERARALTAAIPDLWHEFDDDAAYEGRFGASPRELQGVLHAAVSRAGEAHVSPLGVLAELRELCKQTKLYEFLRIEAEPGGFHDHVAMIDLVRDAMLTRVDEQARHALGLIDDTEHNRMFDRYVSHVTHWLRKENVRNPNTGKSEPADVELMREVETILEVGAPNAEGFRQSLISKIGAWSLDHPGERPIPTVIFDDLVRRLRDAYYDQQKDIVGRGVVELFRRLTDNDAEMEPDARARAARAEASLIAEHGYTRESARELIGALVSDRYR